MGASLRVLVVSDAPWATSGYAVQAKLLLRMLRDLGHAPAMLAAYGLHGGRMDWEGFPIFPGGLDGFGNDVIGPTARAWRADIVLTLKDVVVYQPQAWGDGIRWCPLVPVDHDPIPPSVVSVLRGGGVFLPIAYSRFGLQQLERSGFVAPYAPHAYDSRVFYPLDRAEARRALGIAPDVFAVGMVAVNRMGAPSRKAWPQNLEGFALFARQCPNAHLFAHTYDGREGHEGAYNLIALCEQLGLAWDAMSARNPNARVHFADQDLYKSGASEEYLRLFYNAIDVLNAVSLGEGFGVPTLEAQACGTPVIIGDWCSSSELLFAGAALAPEDALRFYSVQMSYVYIPHPKAIAGALAAMEERTRSEGYALRERAVIGAQRYEMARVREDWRETMRVIARKLQIRPRGVLAIVRPETLGIVQEEARR